MSKLCRKCQVELTPGNLARGKYGNICSPCNKTQRSKKHLANKEQNNLTNKKCHQKRMQDPEYRKKHAKNNLSVEYHRKYREDNREKLNAQSRELRKQPKHKVRRAAECRTRQANKLNATPAWADKGYIQLFYEGAKIEEQRIGKKVHVDHIVPLQHDLVCGLHCEDNLQWLTAKANLAKSNIFNERGTNYVIT